MKMMYKNKQVANTTLNYNELVNKPYINSIELVGNVTAGDLDIYNKDEVDNLIASGRSVKVVSELPSPTVKNTMYYVGPDASGDYHVYLFDSDNTMIDLGTSKIAEYKAGRGIKIDVNNNVSMKSGNYIIYDSEGAATIDADTTIDSSSTHLQLATSQAVYNSVSKYLPLAGGTMTGVITYSSGKKDTDYLPLTGGTMTGPITFSDARTVIKRVNASNYIHITGGTADNTGAEIYLYGKDSTSQYTNNFVLRACDGTNSMDLRGKADGTLTWNGKGVLTQGCTLTGALKSSVTVPICQAADNSLIQIRGGSDWGHGANLNLCGYNYTADPNLTGAWELLAYNSSSSNCTLIGKPNGSLTWGGKNVMRTSTTTAGTYTKITIDASGNVTLSN